MEDDWMTGEWMTDKPCVFVGMQAELGVLGKTSTGMQVEGVVESSKATGMQALLQITDGSLAVGMQVEGAGGTATGMQVRVALYNTNNLRILCEFLSRGVTGNNWTASSTATGDYDAVNLNTDIVEQIWRSGNLATQIVACDAQNPVLVDTLAILNHNFSRGSSLTLQASNQSDFSVIGINESLQWTDTNIFWISEELPTTSYQYWRIVIDDTTNSDGFVEMGTVIFGSSEIFQGEFIVDDINFGYRDFVDKVNTEGFTNVSNSRSLKKTLGLEFSSLNSFKGNYEIIRDLVTTYRTTHKCLWIPTPSLNNQEATARYALFSKLSELPREIHRSPSNDLDYASFSIELDESN